MCFTPFLINAIAIICTQRKNKIALSLQNPQSTVQFFPLTFFTFLFIYLFIFSVRGVEKEKKNEEEVSCILMEVICGLKCSS